MTWAKATLKIDYPLQEIEDILIKAVEEDSDRKETMVSILHIVIQIKSNQLEAAHQAFQEAITNSNESNFTKKNGLGEIFYADFVELITDDELVAQFEQYFQKPLTA